jgi:hypothetical protein
MRRYRFLFTLARWLRIRPTVIHVENANGDTITIVSYKRVARARGWKV